MADIFLSYAREDRDKAERLAHALEGQGWSLLRAGLACHYTIHSSDADLAAAEASARAAERGLWSLPNPVPPWEISRQGKNRVYRGNVRSRVFHAPWCRYYHCTNSTRELNSREEALAAGYRPGGHCKP